MKKIISTMLSVMIMLAPMKSIATTGHINGCTNTTFDTGCCTKTFNITPHEGYRVIDVIVNGVSQGAITSYTFSNITGPQTLKVVTEATGDTGESGSGETTTESDLVSVAYSSSTDKWGIYYNETLYNAPCYLSIPKGSILTLKINDAELSTFIDVIDSGETTSYDNLTEYELVVIRDTNITGSTVSAFPTKYKLSVAIH